MSQVIIYNQDNGIPAVIMPTEECLQQHGIMAIAIKDVPAGKPFKIVDASELPCEVAQEAWVVDDADLDDGVGGESNEFPAEEVTDLTVYVPQEVPEVVEADLIDGDDDRSNEPQTEDQHGTD